MVRSISSEEKAVEVASRDHPLEAARDFLEWCAENGGNAAGRILDELREKEVRAEVIGEMKQMFVEVAKSIDFGNVTHSMFDQWLSAAFRDKKISYGILAYRDAIKDTMRQYFNWYDGENDGQVSVTVDKSQGIYV